MIETIRDREGAAFIAGYAAAKRHSADKLDELAAKQPGGDAALTYIAGAFRVEALAVEASATPAERISLSLRPTSLVDQPTYKGEPVPKDQVAARTLERDANAPFIASPAERISRSERPTSLVDHRCVDCRPAPISAP